MKVIPFPPAVKRVSIVPFPSEAHPAAQLVAIREQLTGIIDEAQLGERETATVELLARAVDLQIVECLGGAEQADASPRLLAAIRDLVERLEVAP
jgi:hypothetical protein